MDQTAKTPMTGIGEGLEPARSATRSDKPISDTPRDVRRPRSAAHPMLGYIGALVVASVVLWVTWRPFYTPVEQALLVFAIPALCMFFVDVMIFRVHRRATTGLDWSKPRAVDAARLVTKFIGLSGTLGVLVAIYWLFPTYKGSLFQPAFDAARMIAPLFLLVAPVYIILVDRYMRDPNDGYVQAGLVLLGRWREINRPIFWNHCRGWLVKGFYLPLMFSYLVSSLTEVQGHLVRGAYTQFLGFYELMYSSVFLFDLAFAVIGYSLTLRVFDNQIRSAEPTLLGWLVTILCYQPFWSMLSAEYFAYDDNIYWGPTLAGYPVLQMLWGSIILVLMVVYGWATICFGTRFSNLTHRGIITHGPYRLMKHPAYVCKNLSWWLISLPFLNAAGPTEALRLCLLVLIVNLIYVARAITEERHLAQDPTYRAYQLWIRHHGLVAMVRRMIGLKPA